MFKKILLIFLAMIVSNSAFADVDQTGKVTRLIFEGNNIVSVWLSNSPTGADCPSDGRWIIDGNTDAFTKEKISLLLTSATTGQEVHLHHRSSDGCAAFNAKNIYFIDVQYPN